MTTKKNTVPLTDVEKNLLPLPQPFWERPKPKDVGDSDEDSIYLAVGKATTAWEKLEMSFASLYSVLIGTDSIAALRAYGTISSATGRREALREAAQVVFWETKYPPVLKTRCSNLINHYEQAASRRNDIAHGLVMTITSAITNGLFLTPAHYNSKKVNPYSKPWNQNDPIATFGFAYRLTSQDIRDITTKFDQLRPPISKYVVDLSSFPAV